MITKLRPEDEAKCRSTGKEMLAKALAALNEGYAFCPSCNWAGMSNCGYFDECGGGIFPSDYAEGSNGEVSKDGGKTNEGSQTNPRLDS